MKSITMAACAKIGILSLFSFAYAMDKDSIGLNEDILAIASKGKYSDNMPHVRRLTASEKEKVLGGIRYYDAPASVNLYLHSSGTRFVYGGSYQLLPTESEMAGRRLDIGRGDSREDYIAFARLHNMHGGIYFSLYLDRATNTFDKHLITPDGIIIEDTPFTRQMFMHVSYFFTERFSNTVRNFEKSMQQKYGY